MADQESPSNESAAAAERYSRFNFDGNDDWKRYRANLVFPAGCDEATLTEKYRQKWFQRNVDPLFSPTLSSSGTSSPAPEVRRTNSPPAAPKIESLDGDDDDHNSNDNGAGVGVGASSPSSQSSQNSRSSPSPQPQPHSQPRAQQQQQQPSWVRPTVNAGNLAVLFFGVLAIISGSASFFRYTLLAAIFNNSISLFQIYGAPKLSMQYFAQVSTNDNFQYIFYCVIFIVGYPFPMSLVPLMIFAFYNSSESIRALLAGAPVAAIRNLGGKIALLTQPELVQKALMLVANNEVITMPVLIVYAIFGYSNFLQVFLYWRFVSQRYQTSHITRLIVNALEHRIDAFVAPLGVVALVWSKIKTGIRWLGSSRVGGAPAQPQQHHGHAH